MLPPAGKGFYAVPAGVGFFATDANQMNRKGHKARKDTANVNEEK